MGEQLGVGACDVEVVGLDRNGGEDPLDERAAGGTVLVVRELLADEQLRCGDGGDRDVVLVADDLVQRTA